MDIDALDVRRLFQTILDSEPIVGMPTNTPLPPPTNIPPPTPQPEVCYCGSNTLNCGNFGSQSNQVRKRISITAYLKAVETFTD